MDDKLKVVIDCIEDKKGKDIVLLDFEGKSSLCDYAVICSGSSNRNIQAIADHIDKTFKDRNEEKLRMEGYRDASWVLIDLDDTVIHILDTETREHYRLEELWAGVKEISRK